MRIQYTHDKNLRAIDVAKVFENSGIRRPFHDIDRIQRMIDNSDVIVSAWHEDRMIGIARAITDFSYCCYLSDLAVDKNFQRYGIGKELVKLIKEDLGDEVSVVLLSSPEALEFYPKIGFVNTDKAFVVGRKR